LLVSSTINRPGIFLAKAASIGISTASSLSKWNIADLKPLLNRFYWTKTAKIANILIMSLFWDTYNPNIEAVSDFLSCTEIQSN